MQPPQHTSWKQVFWITAIRKSRTTGLEITRLKLVHTVSDVEDEYRILEMERDRGGEEDAKERVRYGHICKVVQQHGIKQKTGFNQTIHRSTGP
jgi:hypothetical protein